MTNYHEVLRAIGLNIRSIRVKKGLSQERFAEIAGVHTNYIGKIERGEQNLTMKKIVEIADSLNIPIKKVLDLSDFTS